MSRIRIEVVYAEPARACVKFLDLDSTARVVDALRAAALDPSFAGLDLVTAPVGIFGRAMRPELRRKDGDRIEVYRQLTADPTSARRARAAAARRKTC